MASASKMYQVFVIKEGYQYSEVGGEENASGTVTFVNGPHKIIVDTGNPWDKEDIIQGLAKHAVLPSDIDYVVCTHGHLDHVGNLNLFTNAIYIVSYDICIRNRYLMHDFKEGIPYEIDDYVEVIATPGHTGEDVSVIVKSTPLGVVAITGDLFECQEDLEKPHLWQQSSQKPESQEQYRADILKIADHIIPGHGPMFQVPESCKKQIQMVLLND
ncbi:metallo-beta-lactamase domain-containing protein 1 isoform X1 [Octopus sinensis]|uniref:Metallo-beta-lactamase domain-containing protein 1 n=2 Tax=Octopus sinensis TaxID=2607531 RepID=A0A7E6FHG6_9MOLL|nr:metallo-beta-lactamase domain-containing protein 1 isoform X1 [Octopus sinensis]